LKLPLKQLALYLENPEQIPKNAAGNIKYNK